MGVTKRSAVRHDWDPYNLGSDLLRLLDFDFSSPVRAIQVSRLSEQPSKLGMNPVAHCADKAMERHVDKAHPAVFTISTGERRSAYTS